MKACSHNQRGPRGGKGGYQTQHNDGSMYPRDGARFVAGRPTNLHWDYTMPEGEWLTDGEQAGRTGAAVDSFYDLCQDFGHASSRNQAAIGMTSGLGSVLSKKAAMASAGTL